MRPLLKVDAETDPLERCRADVIVVGVAPMDRPLRGAAGYADWRLRGALWKLVSSGRILGMRGEVSLVISGAGLGSRQLLVLGLGPRRSLDLAAWQELARNALDRSIGLRARRVALPILQDGFLDHPVSDRERAEATAAVVIGAAQAVSAQNVDIELGLPGAHLHALDGDRVPAGVEVQLSEGRVLEPTSHPAAPTARSMPRGVQGNSPAGRFS